MDLEAVAYPSSIDTRQCINPEQSSAVLLSQAVECPLSPSLCLVWAVALSDRALEPFDCSYPLVSSRAAVDGALHAFQRGNVAHRAVPRAYRHISQPQLETGRTVWGELWRKEVFLSQRFKGFYADTEYSNSWLFRRSRFPSVVTGSGVNYLQTLLLLFFLIMTLHAKVDVHAHFAPPCWRDALLAHGLEHPDGMPVIPVSILPSSFLPQRHY